MPRLAISVAIAVSLQVLVFAQILPLKPNTAQYVTVETGTSANIAPPGGSISLWLDVTPKPKIHVYGAGAKGFTPVALTLTPSASFTAAKPAYPATELLVTPGIDERVPVYQKPFRITQPITLRKTLKAGDTITVAGTLSYESCDDRLCYPLASIPLSWIVKIR